jgi:23S rRNA (guanine745-N1)-methyltransferase
MRPRRLGASPKRLDAMQRCVRLLICPVCGANLARLGNILKCPAAHSFDVAREGYVNLLLASRKRPKILGDTKEMARARRVFLDQGFYRPLSDAINQLVYSHLVSDTIRGEMPSPRCFAEIGCGEGYYIGRLRSYVEDRAEPDEFCYYGMDISKAVVKLAARRHSEVFFFVGDVNRRILLSSNSIGVLLNIFAPRNAAEFDRVMTHEGLLLVAIPGPDHLANLRSDLHLLDIEPDKEERVVEGFAGAFRLTAKHTVEYEMHLNGAQLCNLIQMTPNYWHTPKETWDRINSTASVQAWASFIILEFRR